MKEMKMEDEIRATALALEDRPEPIEVDPRALLDELRVVQKRGEPPHPWDREFLRAFREETGLGMPGQEAAGVAYEATERSEGTRPEGIRYGYPHHRRPLAPEALAGPGAFAVGDHMNRKNEPDAEWVKAMAELEDEYGTGITADGAAIARQKKEDTVSASKHQEIGERRAMLWVMELLGFHPLGNEDDFRVATIKLKEELPRMIEADRRILFDDGAKSVRKKIEDYLRNRKLRLDHAVEECAKIEEQMSAAKKKMDDLKSEMAALVEVASMISEPDRE